MKVAESPESSVAIVPVIVPVTALCGSGERECGSRGLGDGDEGGVGWHRARGRHVLGVIGAGVRECDRVGDGGAREHGVTQTRSRCREIRSSLDGGAG